MKVVIDCDEVLRDFVGSLTQVYTKHYPDHKLIPITEWELDQFFPIGKDIYQFAFEEHVHSIFGQADVIPGAKEMMNTLKKYGHELIICTSQPKHKEWITLEWLEAHSIPYDSVVFTKDKSIVDAPILLDDGLHNLQSFKHLAIAFDRPWNRDWSGFRVHTHAEFTDFVQRMGRSQVAEMAHA